jgi:hypothetical protein
MIGSGQQPAGQRQAAQIPEHGTADCQCEFLARVRLFKDAPLLLLVSAAAWLARVRFAYASPGVLIS